MPLSTAHTAQIIKTYQRGEKDTGSAEVQIALLTARIITLTEHLKSHKHDYHTQYGLTNMVSQRRRMMNYLKKKDQKRYSAIIKSLEIRG